MSSQNQQVFGNNFRVEGNLKTNVLVSITFEAQHVLLCGYR